MSPPTSRTINGYVVLPWRAGMFEQPKRSGYVYEHREVAARMLGRPLTPAEAVHHEDEIRHHNAPDNLFVFRTRGDHTRFHAGGAREDMGDGTWTTPPREPRSCACGTVVLTPDAAECPACAAAARRKVNRPSAEELHALVWSMPTTAVAASLGVSDVAVGKWCKALGVSKPPRGYWNA